MFGWVLYYVSMEITQSISDKWTLFIQLFDNGERVSLLLHMMKLHTLIIVKAEVM